MIVVTRWRIPDVEAADTLPGLQEVRRLFEVAGALTATLGRNLDEPDLWVLVTIWSQVGNYRRALSSYEMKMAIGPIMHLVLDEPSAFEEMDGAAEGNKQVPRSLS